MRAIYNGVDLMALETHYMNWEPVYDESGTDYLFTRVSFACRAVINGMASVLPDTVGPFMNYGFSTNTTREGVLRTAGRGGPPGAGSFAPPRMDPLRYPRPTPPTSEGIDRPPPDFRLRAIALNPFPNFPGGNDPVNTLAAIRHRLTTPRGKLYIFWGPGMESGTPTPGSSTRPRRSRSTKVEIGKPTGANKTIGGAATAVVNAVKGTKVTNVDIESIFLESPLAIDQNNNFPCDCKNGPIPRLLGVVESVGDAQTLMVDWSVETYINESQDNNVSTAGPLLSNRFSQTHQIRDDSYTVLTTEGEALFRSDFVYNLPQSPDEKRSVIFMPIPLGFTRRILYVKGRPDATGVKYGYEDTQQSVNFVAGPYVKAASISVVHRQAVYNQPDLWANGPLAVYERVLGIAANKHFAKMDKDGKPVGKPPSAGGRRAKPIPRAKPVPPRAKPAPKGT